ncbi:MAG: acyl-CoA dehydrogenase family protein [Burkholderiales bacterium]|nr:acyl-CoA dehydrogenase family protein [Burkholderiales bacterium]MDP2398748.1 acyl-CoA dehydrogenase family protein [Burkholderiales bacterium]
MDFTLPEELRMLRDTVARFVREELLPLERDVIKREAERGLTDAPLIDPDAEKELNRKAKEIGLYGIDVPEEYGGQNMGMLAKAVVIEELKTSIVPFVLPPDSPNLWMLRETCKGDQIKKYLLPYASGDKKSAIAISEPGAGSDPAGMKTRAEYKNGKWLLNGQKIWISGARKADFIIVMAVTDPEKGSRGGITAFLVDKGAKGLSIPSVFNTMGEHAPYAVFFDNVELSEDQVMGEVGKGFAPMQNRLGVRRMEIACRSLGYARRCMDYMLKQANERKTFGALLADRQQVQWWLADSWQEMEMVRWITWRLAWKMDQGGADWRREAAMVKLQGSEMIARVSDRAIQLLGGMGVSKDLPLEYIARACRVFRIFEGPSEVHRWFIARDLLRNGMPAD